MTDVTAAEKKTILDAKLLMVASALFMGALGIGMSFFPQEILAYYGIDAAAHGKVLMQIAGALYLGFAILNWMARGNPIGGIYSRPVALGNFFHFTVVGITLLRELIAGRAAVEFVIGAGACLAFAIGFGYLVFRQGKSCS